MKTRNPGIPNTGIAAQSKSGVLVSIYVVLLILTPIFRNYIAIPFRLDDIFLLFLVARMFMGRLPSMTFPNTVLLCFTFSSFVGIVVAMATRGGIVFADINDVFVAFRLVLIVTVVQYYLRTTEDIDKVFKWLFIAICISAVVAVLQYFRVSPLDRFLIALYSQDDKYLSMLTGRASVFRVIATYGNPNYTGFFFTIGTVYCLHMIAQRRGWSTIYAAIAVSFVVLCVLALSSRTSLVLLIACSGFYFIAYMYVNKHLVFKNIRLCMKIAAVLALLIFACSLLPPKIIPYRITRFLDASGSLEQLKEATQISRSENWERTQRELDQSGMWMLGNGPPHFVIDSEYFYIIYSQGITGLCLVFILWAWPILTFRKLRSPTSKNIAIYVLTILVALAVFGVAAPVLFSSKTGPLAAVLLGIWYVLLKNAKLSLANQQMPVRTRIRSR